MIIKRVNCKHADRLNFCNIKTEKFLFIFNVNKLCPLIELGKCDDQEKYPRPDFIPPAPPKRINNV